MGNLSKRFSRSEFACKCNCGDSAVDYELISNLEKLADTFGERYPTTARIAVHINSGHRCSSYDRALKIRIAKAQGRPMPRYKKTSQHLKGVAADFWMELVYKNGKRKKISDDEIADELEKTYVAKHGIGRYKGRTHYDTRTNGPARWDNR